MRLVTQMDVSCADIDKLIEVCKEYLSGIGIT